MKHFKVARLGTATRASRAGAGDDLSGADKEALHFLTLGRARNDSPIRRGNASCAVDRPISGWGNPRCEFPVGPFCVNSLAVCSERTTRGAPRKVRPRTGHGQTEKRETQNLDSPSTKSEPMPSRPAP